MTEDKDKTKEQLIAELRDSRQRVSGLEATASKHNLVEEALRESEEKCRTLLDNAQAIIYRCRADKDWTLIFFSGEVERMTGYPISDFVDNAVRTFASITHPDDRQMVEDMGLACVEEKKPYILDYRILRKDGGIVWIHEEGRGVFDEDGTLKWLEGVATDITERKNAEDALLRERDKLQDALSEIKILRGILPICSSCKKIRDDKGYWNQIESYICDHSDAAFSHGICPECMKEHYPEEYKLAYPGE